MSITFNTNPETKRENCAEHGAFDSENFFGGCWTACPVCDAAEKKRRVDLEDEAKILAEQKRVDARMIYSGIPARFRDRTLENFHAECEGQKDVLGYCRAYSDAFCRMGGNGRGLVFVGKPGTGKTHLAVAIAAVLLKNKRSVMFSTVMRAVRRIKNTWDRNSTENETQAVAAFTGPDLLILDEVGIQFGSDTEKMMLFDILNERYENKKSTILMSNLTLDEVKAYVGDRIFDRLREDGGVVFPFDWESQRGKAA